MRKAVALAATLTVALLAGCGPVRYSVDEWETLPYQGNEYVQERDGVRVELNKRENVDALPANFWATVQACNQYLQPAFGQSGPVMQRIGLIPYSDWVQKVAITNNTDHVIRLNRAVIRLFDPSGSQYALLGYDELQADLMAVRPCPTTASAAPQVRLVPLVNRNVEIVPKTTYAGYLIFKPATTGMAGVWKMSLYEIPIATDQAGRVTKTTHFDIRSIQKHYVATYERPAVMLNGEGVKLIERKEVQ